MMHRFVVILLAFSLVALPLRTLAPVECACSTDSRLVDAGDQPVDVASKCCSTENAPGSDDRNPQDQESKPCDDCECLMPCCGISQSLVALPTIVRDTVSRQATDRLSDTTQVEIGSLHRSRLKRPPRALTAAV